MKRSPRPHKTPANLSESIHRRLNSYALAASAAGVGALALAQPAEAKIVYTPAHHVIGLNRTYQLDLNHDRVIDFAIRNMTFNTGDFIHDALSAVPFGRNGVEGREFVYALPRGALIGAKQPFSAPLTMTSCVIGGSVTCFGTWHQATNRYLGLKFHINGKVHYGWARFNVTTISSGITATLTGYAYETIPNKPIVAGKTKGLDKIESSRSASNPASVAALTPKPATLGVLAIGAPGLSLWRREESVGTVQ